MCKNGKGIWKIILGVIAIAAAVGAAVAAICWKKQQDALAAELELDEEAEIEVAAEEVAVEAEEAAEEAAEEIEAAAEEAVVEEAAE